jgi:hypothetical protein
MRTKREYPIKKMPKVHLRLCPYVPGFNAPDRNNTVTTTAKNPSRRTIPPATPDNGDAAAVTVDCVLLVAVDVAVPYESTYGSWGAPAIAITASEHPPTRSNAMKITPRFILLTS